MQKANIWAGRRAQAYGICTVRYGQRCHPASWHTVPYRHPIQIHHVLRETARFRRASPQCWRYLLLTFPGVTRLLYRVVTNLLYLLSQLIRIYEISVNHCWLTEIFLFLTPHGFIGIQQWVSWSSLRQGRSDITPQTDLY